MRHFFTYGGKSSAEFGTYIADSGQFEAPERVVESMEIPGRNGTLGYDMGRFGNIQLTYSAYIPKGISGNISALRAFLLSSSGYRRLEDSLNPDEYRLAMFRSGISSVLSDRQGGGFSLVFDCKPQRFLKSGEIPVTLTSAGMIITNPTPFRALPLIRSYKASGGTAAITVVNAEGTVTVQINNASVTAFSDMDCDIQDVHEGSTSLNQVVTLSRGVFPCLAPGDNVIQFSAAVSRIDITPRFWTI